MDKKIRTFFQNLILVFIVSIISLILVEIILRLFLPQNLNYTMFDENLMYKHIPNLEFRYSRQEFDNIVKFNSKGLRDYEHDYNKGKNAFRILILGDSFPEALQVNLNETFAKVLEQKLNRGYKRYEVIDAGIGGYGTENELLFFETEGIKYNPDFVILAFALNDVDDNLLSPLISVENNKLIKNIPVKISLLKNFMLYCSRHSHLCALTQKVLLQSLKDNEFLRIAFDKLKISSRGNSKKVNSKSGLDIYLKDNSEIFEKGMNETFLTLLELNRILKENNVKFAIFLMPSKEQVDDELYKAFLQKNGLSKNDVDIIKLQKLVTAFAKSNNISIINPLDYLKERNVNNSFYFTIDGHFNKNGHKAIAEFLYGGLENQKILS